MVNKEILTYVVVDAIIMNIFLMFNFQTNPNNRNIELTLLYLGASVLVMTIISFALYYLYFKKRKT